jgi:hypothetical protein
VSVAFSVRRLSLVALGVLLVASSGCGHSASETDVQGRASRIRHQREQARPRAQRHRHQVRVRARRQAAHRTHLAALRRSRTRERQAEAEKAEALAGEEEAASEEASTECDPNYTGACLKPNVSDYDCEGGSGDGPYYTGEVTVVGEDHYGLDANNNGVGCESE